MHLISTVCTSHHYAALCKLWLIPAYYPSAKSSCLISSSLAAAAEEQPCSSVEAHLTHNPCCSKDSGASRANPFQSHRHCRPKNHCDILHHLLACTFKKLKAEVEERGGNQGWGWGEGWKEVRKSKKSRTRAYTKTCDPSTTWSPVKSTTTELFWTRQFSK